MPMRNLLDNGQSRAGAVHLAPHRPVKQMEDPLCLFRFNPDSPVPHHEADPVVGALHEAVRGQVDLRGLAGPMKLQRISN